MFSHHCNGNLEDELIPYIQVSTCFTAWQNVWNVSSWPLDHRNAVELTLKFSGYEVSPHFTKFLYNIFENKIMIWNTCPTSKCRKHRLISAIKYCGLFHYCIIFTSLIFASLSQNQNNNFHWVPLCIPIIFAGTLKIAKIKICKGCYDSMGIGIFVWDAAFCIDPYNLNKINALYLSRDFHFTWSSVPCESSC